MVPARELFINGRWVPPSSGKYLDVVNPATEQVIGRIPAANASDVNAAVGAATAAHKQGVWGRASGAHRAGVLRAIAELVSSLLAVVSMGELPVTHLPSVTSYHERHAAAMVHAAMSSHEH